MGSPQRGQSGRPAESTDSACFEKAITWSWLSQKRMLGASSTGGASVAPPPASWLATRTNLLPAVWEPSPHLPTFHQGEPGAGPVGTSFHAGSGGLSDGL